MDHERDRVVKSQSRADRRLVVEVDSHQPDGDQLVEAEVVNPHPSRTPRKTVKFLCDTEGDKDQPAVKIAGVGPPILQDAAAHLLSPVIMEVFIYLPEACMPSTERQLAWEKDSAVGLEQTGKSATAQAWLYQTWLKLRRVGFETRLVHQIPREGILVTLTGFLPEKFRPPGGLFVAAVVADGLPHPGAQLQIVQNSVHARRLPGAVFMPHWPNPGLVPRDASRGDLFERICFYGDSSNLAAELSSAAWRAELQKATGAELEIRASDRWHDYSDTDAVLAVRSFSTGRLLHKPATKLYNAWLAGVPFVGGMDSAYAGDGTPGANYLKASSPQEVIDCLSILKHSPERRRELVGQGKRMAAEFSAEAICSRWIKLLGVELPRLASTWEDRSPALRRLRHQALRAVCALDRILRN